MRQRWLRKQDRGEIEMNFQNIQMNNGTVLTATKTEELVRYIVNKFSEENLTYDEANIILENTKDVLGEFSKIEKMS